MTRKVSYKSINDAVHDAITQFKEGNDIDSIIDYINKDYEGLTEWMYSNDFHLCNEDFLWHKKLDEFFLVEEKLDDYFENPAKDLNFKNDSEIKSFIAAELSSFDEHSAYQYCWIDDLFLSGRVDACGQGGHELYDFSISSNFNDFLNSCKEKNIVIWNGDPYKIKSHSIKEMIALYEKLIRPRLKDY